MQSSRIELTVLGIILHSELLVESGSGNRVEINSLARSLLFFFFCFRLKRNFFFFDLIYFFVSDSGSRMRFVEVERNENWKEMWSWFWRLFQRIIFQ